METVIENAARQGGVEKLLLPDHYRAVPHELREQVNTWVLWKYTDDGRKMPLDWTHKPGAKYKGANDPALHLSFDAALAKAQTSGARIGLYLGDGVRICAEGCEGWLWCLDLDGFAGADDAGPVWEAAASELWEATGKTYAEVSPSGTGLKMFFVCDVPPMGKRVYSFEAGMFAADYPDIKKYVSPEIEVFSRGYYVAVTGAESAGTLRYLDHTDTMAVLQWLDGHGTLKTSSTALAPLGFEVPPYIAHVGVDDTTRNLMGCSTMPETEDNIQQVRAWLDAMGADCNYETWRNLVWSVASLGWNCGQELAQQWSMTAADRYREDVFNRTWDSYRPSGIGIGTLAHAAQAAGYKPSTAAPQASTTHNVPGSVASTPGISPALAASGWAASTPRFNLLTRADLHHLPELEWRIDSVLPMTGIGLVIGQSGAGKSFITLDLLACVSLGLPWFDHDTRPCKTVYIGLEGRAGIKRRVEAWERQNSAQVPGGFAVVLDTLKLTELQDVEDLAHAILDAGGQGGLIVIDTLAQSAPGIDENSSADMGLLIEALQRLQALTDGLVLAVHHMGKDTTRGARGHSSLYAACDVVLAVASGPQGHSVSTETSDGGKSKDAEPVSHVFDLGRVVLHTMDDGHEIAGAAVVPMADAPRAALPKSPKGGNVKIVWDHLGRLLREAGDIRPADAPDELPEGQPTVRLDDAVAKIAPMLACEVKRQTERTRTAITSLMNSGHLVHVGGWLWTQVNISP